MAAKFSLKLETCGSFAEVGR